MRNLPDSHISQKITRLYLLALTAVALLLLAGQWLVQQSLARQANDSRVVNIAGRQRMLSQKISKTVLLLCHPALPVNTQVYLSDLKDALAIWQKSHNNLKNGYRANNQTPVKNSQAVQAMFIQIEPVFRAIYQNAAAIQRNYSVGIAALQPNVKIILENERAFLQGMDKIVFQYDAEAAQRVNASRRTERILLGCALLVLLLEGLFIFRPAVKQIKHTIGLLVNSEKQTQRINADLLQANKSLAETREALLLATKQKHRQELNEQKLRATYVIEGQEEERKRVARELHDGLGQMLTALKFGLEKCNDVVTGNEPAQHHLTQLRELVSQTITETRTISYNLMPAVLHDFGISSALKLLVSQVTTSAGIQISYTSNYNGNRLPQNLEIGLYRVAQEGLHNAVKYARAQEIKIELTQKKKYIHLIIADNGRGFTYTPAGEPGLAQGLSNMQARVFMLDGNINIISSPGQGTRISVKIPLGTTKAEYAKN